ncbi:conserved hypothetical protein [Desulforapulum autotrophicum HRM2]|uniref:CHAT domain-containing protein n=1 Tax=Desulforapulum autotrophicum (strain ATCC 43914 / DSM 3382 / VKM B-1955 / HRM2) TaxID=177437 RepID=C0QIY2_DESAH|nr:CHAT domain-containing protein [Desulforapulum autotrophicum]ACN13772.1 conserved hypothetical protein [Desulforapulum autotrophicum HRM2]
MSNSKTSFCDYPLGDGPLEKIYEAAATGEIRLDRALEIAASQEVTSHLTSVYAHAFGFHAARNALRGRWREGLMQHRILLAAARAVTGPEARMARIRAEKEGIVTVACVLFHMALGRAYVDAMNGGDWLLETIDPVREKTLLAETFHDLGVLNLDPFTAHRTFENREIEHHRWLARTAQEIGPDSIEGLPNIEEALVLAQDFLENAVQLAEGNQLSDSMKALYQAKSWLEGLQQGDFDASLLADALNTLDPMQDPARWLALAVSGLRQNFEIDSKKAEEIFSIPLSAWIAKFGKSKAFEIVIPLLDFQRFYDPQAALKTAEEGYELMVEEPVEVHRSKFYNQVFSLFVMVAKRAGVNTNERIHSVERVLNMDESIEVRAMCLIGLASDSMRSDDELSGLAMFDRSLELAPGLHQRFLKVMLYLKAHLWLGIGSNSMKAMPAKLACAAAAYGNALAFMLEAGLSEHAFDLLKRLEDIAAVHDSESSEAILSALVTKSLQAELAMGYPGQAVLRSICHHLTLVFFERDNALLTLVWQIAKGRRSAAILTSPSAVVTGDTPESRKILAKVDEARKALHADQKYQGQFTSGDASFELWLSSYIRGDYYDGDQSWERFANLKMTFDGKIFDSMASHMPPTCSTPVALPQIQQRLDSRSALLIVYLGKSSDGRDAVYCLAVTREEAIAHVHVHEDLQDETSWFDGERTAVRAQLGCKVGELRSALLEDPGDNDVGLCAGAILQQGLSSFYAVTEKTLGSLLLKGKNHLIVAPHDALHFLPFHLFSVGGAPIIDSFAVTYLPNLALISTARRSHIGSANPEISASVGIGFVGEAGGWQAIPEAVAEARAVAEVLNTVPLLDAQCTKTKVIDTLQSSRYTHIATHGAMDVDAPAFQMLVLHPVEDEENGRLYAYEILQTDLRSLEIVSLGACETALGRIDRADNLRGMITSLFSAGVAAVVGTLWPVESRASEVFFTTFYTQLSNGYNRCDAFYGAQVVTRKVFPQYRDWGSFYLAGEWW